ncbi:rhodanese-like domain-containing protein, partial [Comamonas sp. B-9]
EPYEQQLGQAPGMDDGASSQAVPLSGLLNALPQWLALPADTPVVFYCRSGNRSAQAAHALRRLGHQQAFSVAGGLALWPERATAPV